MSQQTINIPDGFELVQTSETTFEIKKKQKQLPKTWEEFCRINPIKNDEAYINSNSTIKFIDPDVRNIRDIRCDKNILPTVKDAEGILALMQLIQLRDYYNDGWKPDWACAERKYVIKYHANAVLTDSAIGAQSILSFKTRELRDEFLENFKDLIEQAKDFI